MFFLNLEVSDLRVHKIENSKSVDNGIETGRAEGSHYAPKNAVNCDDDPMFV